ncbi:MAG: DUF2938 family protein, partial [Pseudomonadota bacterium]|nr:DUF2938 family protein [Pseudomonadota bacterium]
MEQQVLLFILFVGIGSTMVLDIWANIAPRLGWLPGTHWPSVGRWLRGLLSSHFVINGEDTSPTTVTESFL